MPDAPRQRTMSIILQDLPAEHAALGYDQYAEVLARLIRQSRPRLAVGIFGGWGSGKTTLMNAIARKLLGDKAIIVEFSAWRYEREPNLIVPLLDTIREALVAWTELHPQNRPLADATVRTLGRAVKALLAGVAFKAGLPNAFEVSYDASRTIDTWDQAGLDADETRRSLYHACFTALTDAFRTFAAQDPARRIVVFVDDLDRCLPNGAMEVIEAMKLFFDLDGFVFVVGLDHKVIEAAVEIRYREFNEAHAMDQAKIKGDDYIKKIFQVPFSLAPVSATELDTLIESYLDEAGAAPDQRHEINGTVLGHLRYVTAENAINPRDIKRFINTYTIASAIKPGLDRNVVLALQSMSYRADWRRLYQSLLAFRHIFIQALQKFASGSPDALEDLDDDLATVPPAFARYISNGEPGAALRTVLNIDDYIYAGEATKATGNPALVDTIFAIAGLRADLKELPTRLGTPDHARVGEIARRTDELAARVDTTEVVGAREAAAEMRKIWRLIEQMQQTLGDQPRDYDWKPLIDRLKAVMNGLIAYY